MQKDKFKVPFKAGENNLPAQKVDVHIESSTDDVDTYVCHLNGERITQLRKDSGEWKQLWGELDDQKIKQLGEQIDLELAK